MWQRLGLHEWRHLKCSFSCLRVMKTLESDWSHVVDKLWRSKILFDWLMIISFSPDISAHALLSLPAVPSGPCIDKISIVSTNQRSEWFCINQSEASSTWVGRLGPSGQSPSSSLSLSESVSESPAAASLLSPFTWSPATLLLLSELWLVRIINTGLWLVSYLSGMSRLGPLDNLGSALLDGVLQWGIG